MNWVKRWQTSTGGQTGHLPHIVESIKSKLKLDNNVNLLEVGCGSGSLLEKLPAKTKTGLDPTKILLEQARKRGLNVVEGVSWKLPFPDNSFDRVLFYSVIHYMTKKQADKTISELKRVCTPNGLILVGDIGDVKHYRFGPLAYALLREPTMTLLGMTRATFFNKKWFTQRGFLISPSANSEIRFDALFEKR